MPYCTAADVRAALTPDALQDAETAASLKDWQLDDAISEAEDIVNAYITQYQIHLEVVTEVGDGDPNSGNLPFEIAPNPIRRWTRDIAGYLAALTYRRNKDLTVDDPIRLRYNLVMAQLVDVRNNVATLPLPPADGLTSDGVAIFNLYEGTLFGPEDFDLTAGSHTTQQIWRSESAVE